MMSFLIVHMRLSKVCHMFRRCCPCFSHSTAHMSSTAAASVASSQPAFVHPIFPLPTSASSPSSTSSSSSPINRLLYSAHFDVDQLQSTHPPRFRSNSNKDWVWKQIQSKQQKEKQQQQQINKSNPSSPSPSSSRPPIRFARYDSRGFELDLSTLVTNETKVTFAQGPYAYDEENKLSMAAAAMAGNKNKNQSTTTSSSSFSDVPVHWYVNFADESLFGFYSSELFAQDEWQCLEHPILASLREYLHSYSISSSSSSSSSSRDRSSSHPEASPLTVERSSKTSIPTPCLTMHVAREVSIDALGSALYGHAFARAKISEIQDACQWISPTWPSYSNILAMEALKYGKGRYTHQQIAATIQTILTGFTAARLESEEEARRCFGCKHAAASSSESSGFSPPSPSSSNSVRTVMHTGNFGCGAFGGNKELMFLLQYLCARASGTHELVYHVLSEENHRECQRAQRVADEIIKSMTMTSQKEDGEVCNRLASGVNESTLLSRIVSLGYKWGRSNGT